MVRTRMIQTCKTCVPCDACAGEGLVWYSRNGRYQSHHRYDEADKRKKCEFCDDGVLERCEACREAEDAIVD